MKFKKNVFSNIILHIVNIALGFFTSIFIARSLGAANQGQFSYYLLIFGMISSYGGLGIINSNSYFIKKSKFEREDIINSNISTIMILSLIYIILIVLLQTKIFTNESYILTFVWITYTLILLFNNFLLTIYVADENIFLYNKWFIIIYVLRGIIIGVMYYTKTLNIFSLSLIYAAVEVFKLIVLLIGVRIKYRFNINFNILKSELKYGLPIYFSGLFIYLNYRIDQIIVKEILGNAQLGIYSIAVHLADLAFVFPDSIKASFEGLLYNCKEDEKNNLSARIIKLSFYVTLAICLIGIFCNPLVTILYGVEYEKSGTVMIILLIGIIFVSIGKVAPAYFSTQGKTKIPFIVSGLVLSINYILNILLIPQLGIIGAAIATTIAYTFFGASYIILLKKNGIQLKQILKLQKEDKDFLKKHFIKKLKNKKKERDVIDEKR